MKHFLVTAVSLAALSLTACGKHDETTPSSEASDMATASDAATASNAAMGTEAAVAVGPGQAFANGAAASDKFEIESSQLAASKAASAKVKSFAEKMIKAHTDSTAKLKAAAAKASPAITPVPELTTTQQQTLTELGGKSGAEFDTAYAKAQVDAHQMALDALKGYSANGDVPSLKAFATEVMPVVTAHLNMAKEL